MTEPYEGTEEYGVPIIKDEVLEHYVKQALDDNMQILAHCNGDATGDQYLGAIEKICVIYTNFLRFTNYNTATADSIYCSPNTIFWRIATAMLLVTSI